jgi:hypothetical protein
VEERKRSKRWRIAMKAVEWILRQLRSLSPYLAVELLLPGGSIVALLLWTYRHRTAARPTADAIASNPRTDPRKPRM